MSLLVFIMLLQIRIMLLRNLFLIVIVISIAKISFARNLNSNPNQDAEKLFLAYELADCNSEEIFFNAYTATKNNATTDDAFTSISQSSMMLETCDECPDLAFASLQGIAGFPQVNDLSLCGAADTVSILVYNAGECPL